MAATCPPWCANTPRIQLSPARERASSGWQLRVRSPRFREAVAATISRSAAKVPMRCCTGAEAQSVRFHRSSTQRTSNEASRARGNTGRTLTKTATPPPRRFAASPSSSWAPQPRATATPARPRFTSQRATAAQAPGLAARAVAGDEGSASGVGGLFPGLSPGFSWAANTGLVSANWASPRDGVASQPRQRPHTTRSPPTRLAVKRPTVAMARPRS